MGSSHEKVAASPLTPENSANTGVMQHSDAAIAANKLAPAVWDDNLSVLILLLPFD